MPGTTADFVQAAGANSSEKGAEGTPPPADVPNPAILRPSRTRPVGFGELTPAVSPAPPPPPSPAKTPLGNSGLSIGGALLACIALGFLVYGYLPAEKKPAEAKPTPSPSASPLSVVAVPPPRKTTPKPAPSAQPALDPLGLLPPPKPKPRSTPTPTPTPAEAQQRRRPLRFNVAPPPSLPAARRRTVAPPRRPAATVTAPRRTVVAKPAPPRRSTRPAAGSTRSRNRGNDTPGTNPLALP